MGSRESVLDDDKNEEVDLRHAAQVFDERWRGKSFRNLAELGELWGASPDGLEGMFSLYAETNADDFLARTLPFIIELAAKLPEELPALKLKKLAQGKHDRLFLSRSLVASLMAHMFLCTINSETRSRAMPEVSFGSLHVSGCSAPQEVAKLRMFVNYFERIRVEPPRGQLRIYRQVRRTLDPAELEREWSESSLPLLPIDMVDMHIGFENVEKGEGCLHADFANMFLGGGVLSGGCVQEEIRFAICPELCAAMIVCPCMLENEAITVVGGEQFSEYGGYAFSLEFAGDFRRPAPKDGDGTPLVAITAMDALDLRSSDSSLEGQMQLKEELRELEKAAAAFAPVDEEALKTWPIIATGNWGCGAFGGSIPLKAVLQWLAASQGRRSLRYFPFDAPIGPEFTNVSNTLCHAGITVGQLFTALRDLKPPEKESDFLTMLQAKALSIARKVQSSGNASRTESHAKAKPDVHAKAKATRGGAAKRNSSRSPGRKNSSPGSRR